MFSPHTVVVDGGRRRSFSTHSFGSLVRPLSAVPPGSLVRSLSAIAPGSLVRPPSTVAPGRMFVRLAIAPGSLVRPLSAVAPGRLLVRSVVAPVRLFVRSVDAVVGVGWSIAHRSSLRIERLKQRHNFNAFRHNQHY